MTIELNANTGRGGIRYLPHRLGVTATPLRVVIIGAIPSASLKSPTAALRDGQSIEPDAVTPPSQSQQTRLVVVLR